MTRVNPGADTKRLEANRWTDTEYTREQDVFLLDSQPVRLKEIYLNIFF